MNQQNIGILMLNTSFPRLPGDVGNANSFRYPTIYRTVDAAVPSNIVTASGLPEPLAATFETQAIELERAGASLITTSCGFLSIIQQRLADALTVPVVSSSLVLLPLLRTLYGNRADIGILTFDATALGQRHLPHSTDAAPAIEGLLPNDSLRVCISNDSQQLDAARAEADVLACADRLIAKQPVSALILECTNMAPYKSALRQHTGCAVYDLVDAVHWILDAGHG
jgi:Asp/Glu/hydantoin racemase